MNTSEIQPTAGFTATSSGAGGNTDISTEQMCRYPNKKCYQPRAIKNNGELHKFCEMHRDSANRYQRRLEQRMRDKRMMKMMAELQANAAQGVSSVAQMRNHSSNPKDNSNSSSVMMRYPTGVEGKDLTMLEQEYEPFHHPVPLQTEDIVYLHQMFLNAD